MPLGASDMKFMRVQGSTPLNNISGSIPDTSEWHVFIPGVGPVDAPWPGLSCGTGLEGALQQESYYSMEDRLRKGEKIHGPCLELADEFLNRVAGTGGARLYSVAGQAAPGAPVETRPRRVVHDRSNVASPRGKAKATKAGKPAAGKPSAQRKPRAPRGKGGTV